MDEVTTANATAAAAATTNSHPTPITTAHTSGNSRSNSSHNVALVNFKVRCERLGHGEEVFLVQQGDDERRQKVRHVQQTNIIFYFLFLFFCWHVSHHHTLYVR